MNICTQLTREERCDGCPLSTFEVEKRPLQPHEELAVTTNVAILIGQQTEDATKETYVRDVNDTYDRIERAVSGIRHLVKDIANWRMVGACDYHEGVVIEDPEMEKRIQNFLLSLSQGEE